jgi:hypothetical protein
MDYKTVSVKLRIKKRVYKLEEPKVLKKRAPKSESYRHRPVLENVMSSQRRIYCRQNIFSFLLCIEVFQMIVETSTRVYEADLKKKQIINFRIIS